MTRLGSPEQPQSSPDLQPPVNPMSHVTTFQSTLFLLQVELASVAHNQKIPTKCCCLGTEALNFPNHKKDRLEN